MNGRSSTRTCWDAAVFRLLVDGAAERCVCAACATPTPLLYEASDCRSDRTSGTAAKRGARRRVEWLASEKQTRGAYRVAA